MHSPRPRGGLFPLGRPQIRPSSCPLHSLGSTTSSPPSPSGERIRTASTRAGDWRPHAPLQQGPSRRRESISIPSRCGTPFLVKDGSATGRRSHISHLAFWSREDGQASRSGTVTLCSLSHRSGRILGQSSSDIVPTLGFVDLEAHRSRVQGVSRFSQSARCAHQ